MPRAARKPPFKLVAPRVPEFALHKQIADVFARELAAPGRISSHGVVWWSQDIASYGGSTPGLRTTRGVIAGVSDMLVLYQGRAFFIEVKASDGLLSEVQREVCAAVLVAGCRYAVARGAEEALKCLDEWGIPRRGAMRL